MKWNSGLWIGSLLEHECRPSQCQTALPSSSLAPQPKLQLHFGNQPDWLPSHGLPHTPMHVSGLGRISPPTDRRGFLSLSWRQGGEKPAHVSAFAVKSCPPGRAPSHEQMHWLMLSWDSHFRDVYCEGTCPALGTRHPYSPQTFVPTRCQAPRCVTTQS